MPHGEMGWGPHAGDKHDYQQLSKAARDAWLHREELRQHLQGSGEKGAEEQAPWKKEFKRANRAYGELEARRARFYALNEKKTGGKKGEGPGLGERLCKRV